MMSIQMRWILIGVVLFFLACSDSVQQYTTTPVITLPPENIILASLNDTTFAEEENLYARCTLFDFYRTRQYSLTWFKKDALTPQGDSLIKLLHQSTYFGLIPEDYHIARIDTLYKRRNDVKSLVKLDMLMTDAFMTMVSHIRNGRLDKKQMLWKTVEIDSALLSIINSSILKNKIAEELKALEPQYSAYSFLKHDLKNKLDSISLGFSDSALTQKLVTRVRDLCANMEQWRWETANAKQPYIMVNIPSFHLDVVNNDSVVFKTSVIVGTPSSQTPTFDARMVNMILYPYWNVPRDISTKELLPKIKRDSSYLNNSRYRVLDMSGNEVAPELIDWRTHNVNNFPFMLQQTEGQHNALGIVKFNFVNPIIFIYMTPMPKAYSMSPTEP
jgi:murein L,D-transpeptidase YcbB/YkuD